MDVRARAIRYFDTVTSTMDLAVGEPLGTVIVANEQTAGQGRHGHFWHSEPGSGLYCSIVLQPAPLLTLALGLATAEAIARATGIACDLRWPNDVMLDGKKVGGILVKLENDSAIAGIGINVNHSGFPPELTAEATSLRMHTGRLFAREAILETLLDEVDTYAGLDSESILRLFADVSSYAAGRRVIVHQPEGLIEGTTAGLNQSGYLIIRQDNGTDTVVMAGGVRAAGA